MRETAVWHNDLYPIRMKTVAKSTEFHLQLLRTRG